MDWEDEYHRVKFRRQDTYDGGATPTLADEDASEVPDLKSVGDELADELREVGQRHESLEDEVETLREKLREREEAIEELQEQLETRDYVSEEVEERFEATATTFADAVQEAIAPNVAKELDVSDEDGGEVHVEMPDELRTEVLRIMQDDMGDRVAELEQELENKDAEVAEARQRVEALRTKLSKREQEVSELEAENEELRERVDEKERLERKMDELREIRDRIGSILGDDDVDDDNLRHRAKQEQERAEAAEQRAEEAEAVLRGEITPEEADIDIDPDQVSRQPNEPTAASAVKPGQYAQAVEEPGDALETLITEAAQDFRSAERHAWDLLHELAEAADGNHPQFDSEGDHRPTIKGLANYVDVGGTTVSEILSTLADEKYDLVDVEDPGVTESNLYALNEEVFSSPEGQAAYYQRRKKRASTESA